MVVDASLKEHIQPQISQTSQPCQLVVLYDDHMRDYVGFLESYTVNSFQIMILNKMQGILPILHHTSFGGAIFS